MTSNGSRPRPPPEVCQTSGTTEGSWGYWLEITDSLPLGPSTKALKRELRSRYGGAGSERDSHRGPIVNP